MKLLVYIWLDMIMTWLKDTELVFNWYNFKIKEKCELGICKSVKPFFYEFISCNNISLFTFLE